jgi:hypothetical protein
MVNGLRSSEKSFGSIGSTGNIDMRASKQWVQTQFGYGLSNRLYRHRALFTKSTGMNQKGWAFSISGTLRYSDEGFVPGTFYRSESAYIGIDKKTGEGNVLSLLLFGSHVNSGKQGPVLKASVDLLQTHLYNPYWGYQAGQKRNANVTNSFQPVIILTDEFRINNQSSLVTTIGVVSGTKSSTALDWYKARDPRPDYYRYLPGYQADSVLQQTVANRITTHIDQQQVDWDDLYAVNRNSYETLANANGITGNDYSGLRSHYLVEERVAGLQRISANILYNTRLSDDLLFSSGCLVQRQQSHYFKKVNDLLGGEYYVDWNQFAERDFPNDDSVIQNDLNWPNRVLQKGDVYGYDYIVRTSQANAWAALNITKKKTDCFLALNLSSTAYSREGRMRNGLFPDHSFGKTATVFFTNPGCKSGITYKINGQKYVYLHGAIISRAPLFDNVFISPRTRDSKQETISSETISSVELGFVRNAPRIKYRISAYLTRFVNGMDVKTFYHDGYGNFVNYVLSGINKMHTGIESGLEWKLNGRLTLSAAIAAGNYFYTSRQSVTVTADNDASALEKTLIYSKGFKVGGTPQQAYGLNIAYQPSGNMYFNLTGNYFRQQWLDFNPLRRTYAAIENVAEGSEQWNRIISQEKLPDQYTLDFFGGCSFRLKSNRSKKQKTILVNVGINNLLNKKDIISGGYEQLRFDTDTKNIDKFPPKYFYAMGLNFSINLTFRIQ